MKKLDEIFHVTYEEFEEKKQREHKERMLEATERDKQISEHPYEYFIPQ